MLISKLVQRVNAKTYGETMYSYEDIYSSFCDAIADVNAELEYYRRLADPPSVEEYESYPNTCDYSFLPDQLVESYIVTAIVVNLDIAQLAITERTQIYQNNLERYKKRVIEYLYELVPALGRFTNSFSLGRPGEHNDKPSIKCSVVQHSPDYVLLEGTPLTAPHIKTLLSVDNPYGDFLPIKDDKDIQRLKAGTNIYKYVFIPNSYFVNIYKPVGKLIKFSAVSLDDLGIYDVITAEDMQTVKDYIYQVVMQIKDVKKATEVGD
jgi:hypothetical protein